MVITAQDAKLKPGYKQTEVGVIPDDWEVKPISESFDIHNHLRYPISREVRKKMAGEYPYYGPTRVQDYINEYRVEGEYALIGEDGDHFLKWRELPMTLLVNGKFNVNNHAHLVKGARNLTSWFFYYFQNKDITSYLTRQGAGRYKLTKNTLVTIPIPLPSLPEQQAIATALSDMDALITSLDKLIAKKRDIKQATMQHLLTGKIRLPGFSGEWKAKTFGEVMTGFASGATPSRNRPEFFKGDIRWITSGELNYNVIMDTFEKISVEAVSKTNLKLLPKGTFLMAITGLEAEGTRGSCGIVGADATTNQSCMALFPTKELSAHFLFHYYVYKGKSLALQYCQGTKQQSYTGKIVKLLPILLPPFDEQEAIVSILSDMDAEITALEQKRDKTRALKQGMMQELLTGRTRLI